MPEDTADRLGLRRIGRYEIAGRLATGGMAEILLGKLLGPSGFERPVVIKRILPHLAELSSFRDMFLDEARLVARIRHPNVVQVNELGTDAGELFLVMEYLEGESLGSLMRRLYARREMLAPGLAAHIISEVCSGLHAAHELCDDDGVHQEVVHRDVSPQNVIVTYDGAVKVLDFGIAKAAHRISQTEAGQVKGKFEYMSPEQCRGEVLDRRSDIFSIGTLLYELVTGARLWKRQSSMRAMVAVCDEPAPPLSESVAAAAVLDGICARALEKKRERRPATAEELRLSLKEALKREELSLDHVADVELGRLMRRLFEDRIAEKRALLRGIKAGEPALVMPRAESDDAVEIPTRTATRMVGALSESQPAEQEVTPPVAGRSRRLILGGALVLSMLGFGLFGWRRASADREPAVFAPSPPSGVSVSMSEPSAATPIASAAPSSGVAEPPVSAHPTEPPRGRPVVGGTKPSPSPSATAVAVTLPQAPTSAPSTPAVATPSAVAAPVSTPSARPGFTRF